MKQFAVLGMGRFGSGVAKTLTEKGYSVLAIDKDAEAVQDASEFVTHAVQVDATEERSLRAIGIENVDVAIVAIGDIEASILITLILREVGIKEIIAKAATENHGKVLRRVGATKIVFPERDMGARIATTLITPEMVEHIDLSPDYSIVEIKPPKEFVGKSLKQINLRAQYGINVIAIKRKIPGVGEEGNIEMQEKIDVVPAPSEVINEGDMLIIVGENKNIEKLK